MAIRPAYYVSNGKVIAKNFDFEWFPGFAVSQKQKSIASLHKAIGEPALEISSKSVESLGRKLSAFFLRLDGYTLENVFQSGKIFKSYLNSEEKGPYRDLLNVSPRDAKKDERLKTSGILIGFEDLEGERWELIPRTAFYDYIYIKAVKQSLSNEEILKVQEYKYFTDIEFNPQKSINTQARTVALLQLIIQKYGEIPNFSKEEFVKFHEENVVK